ncbi:TonB-dependent receptor [Pedobacter africanus]|uniref:TonB-dependent Receptor Plug Domain n=1 Tax=Pedobacter africanus TaxID=151894 RepID=A0A1W2C0M6_9SPHI|nr:TonB-dependent receptor [Pedobacter africanus]SMC78462.1 TonB-dependent Receptor Plug Domain [Pedobacter africanus]
MKSIGPVRLLTLISLILLLLALAQVQARAQDQLAKKVSITLKDEPLKTALDKITRVSGVKFTYNEQIALSKIRISVSARDKPLAAVLEAAFMNEALRFSALDKEVFIRLDPAKEKKPVADPAANPGQNQEKHTLSGTIKSTATGETLIAATIRISGTKYATFSNEYGFYSITLPKGNYAIEAKAVGSKSHKVQVELDKNLVLNIALDDDLNELETVTISANAGKRNIENPQMGMERLSISETKNVPVLLGERDVIKTLQLLPGVKTSGEGSGGFFVRGGSADQNMILLDEAPVYNATHLLGFFSTFNSDAIKNVTLYKSGMPAQYGGGLSSVLDVKMNEGNNQKFGVSGGIGLIAARVNAEGPIQKDKSSFLISARRTYADMFLKLSGDSATKNTQLYFYDLNLKANYYLGEKDRLFISGYFGKDVLRSDNLSGINWGNATSTLRWNHIFSSKLFSNTSLIFSNFNYKIQSNGDESSVRLFSQIRDWNFKEDLQWYANDKNTLSFGFNSIFHTIKPGEVQANGDSGFISQKLQDRYSLENAVYISNTWKASPVLSFTYGLRVSAFSILGKGDYYTLDTEGKVTGATSYKPGELVKTYVNLEPRFAAALQLNESSSIKASYVRNAQNLHLISNANSSSPTDRWVASTNIIKPELSDQVSLGYYKNLGGNAYELTVETYYKTLQNQIDYRNGADIYTNQPIETQLLYGKGRAYGAEFLIKKKTGKLTGWLAYTLSKTERQIDGINNNNWYNARQDRTHDISIVSMYQLSKKWSLSANWVFATGNAVTFPNGKYKMLGHSYFFFSERNADRMPSYHRLDIGATKLLKQTKKFSSELNFSLYNAYGRENAYRITFKDKETDPNRTEAIRTTLFRFVPSISYNFKF